MSLADDTDENILITTRSRSRSRIRIRSAPANVFISCKNSKNIKMERKNGRTLPWWRAARTKDNKDISCGSVWRWLWQQMQRKTKARLNGKFSDRANYTETEMASQSDSPKLMAFLFGFKADNRFLNI